MWPAGVAETQVAARATTAERARNFIVMIFTSVFLLVKATVRKRKQKKKKDNCYLTIYSSGRRMLNSSVSLYFQLNQQMDKCSANFNWVKIRIVI